MLVEFLRENWKIFAWVDMPGIPKKFAEHALEVYKDPKRYNKPYNVTRSQGAEQ